MSITSKPLAIVVVVFLFGGIFFSSVMGWWSTVSTKVPATYTEGEFAGQANPADIRGSYTFGDVEKNFSIDVEVMALAFGVQADDLAAYQVKGLEEQYAGSPVEIGTSSVRLFVAFYNGLPIDLSTDIYLPETAVGLLKERSLSAEQMAYLIAHTAPVAGEVTDEQATQSTPIPEAPTTVATVSPAEAADRTIKGKTTFAELLSWGVTEETIEDILGIPLPTDRNMKIKDFCTANSLDFEIIKLTLQEAVDALE